MLNLNKEDLNILGNDPNSILDCLKTVPMCELTLLVQQHCERTNNDESCLRVKQKRYEPQHAFASASSDGDQTILPLPHYQETSLHL